MTSRSLQACSAKAREWLLDAAFPFWFDKGIDPGRGGFVDLVGVDGTSVPNAPKRIFVQARQVYAFAMAGRLGWPGRWREAVATGLDTIERHCRHPGGGFIHRLDAKSAPDEMRRDLYDQAFVAFAKAHAAAALDRPALADEARAIFADLDRDWLRPPAGYWEGELQDSACRRQNPHMHLFEAALAWEQIEPDARWRGLADEIAELLRAIATRQDRVFGPLLRRQRFLYAQFLGFAFCHDGVSITQTQEKSPRRSSVGYCALRPEMAERG